MPTRVLCRAALLMILGVILSGCSVGGGGSSLRGSECAWYRGSCQYEGSYEADEKDYAEREAQRLNRRESSRLGGGGWFW